MGAALEPAAARAEVERWFVRRGLPHFIDGYDAATGVWTRSLPALVLLYLAVSLNGLQIGRWGTARNLAAVALAVVVLIVVWAGANVARRRPLFERPTRVDRGSLLLLVLGAGSTSALTGQWGDVVQSFVEMAVGLAVIYIVTSYALLPTFRWAGERLVAQLAGVGDLLVRVLPLLMLFVTFLFINADVWQVAATLRGVPYWATLLLFLLVGTVFVVSRLPAELRDLGHFTSWTEVAALAEGSPASALVPDGAPPIPEPSLSSHEWVDAGLVTAISLGLQALLVGAVVGLFFAAFGLVAMSEATQRAWTGLDAHVLWRLHAFGETMVLTEQGLRVAAFLAAFTALYFSVYLVTDPTYRSEFRDEVVGEVRQAFAVRAAYRYGSAAG